MVLATTSSTFDPSAPDFSTVIKVFWDSVVDDVVPDLDDSATSGDYTRSKYAVSQYLDVSYHGDQTVDSSIIINYKSQEDAENLRNYVPNSWTFTLSSESSTVVTATSIVDNGDTFTVNITPALGGTVVVHDGNNPTDATTAQHWETGWKADQKLYHHVTEFSCNPIRGDISVTLVIETMSSKSTPYANKGEVAQVLSAAGLNNGTSAYLPVWKPILDSTQSYTSIGNIQGVFSSDGSGVYAWARPYSTSTAAAAYSCSMSRDVVI
jgi:hypothetical protein